MIRKAEADGGEASGSGPPPAGADGEESAAAAAAAVGDLVAALSRRRVYREVTLALRSGLRDAQADFSFLRTRGLRRLLKFLRSSAAAAASDDSLRLFRHSQSISELQVIPVLFQNTLHPRKENPDVTLNHIFGVEPSFRRLLSLHSGSAALAYKYKAVKVLVNILSNRGIPEQEACLDALIALMLESSSNQMDFAECHGVEKIAELIKDEQADEILRLKCGEFLLLLIGNLNGRENSPLANIQEDIRRLLGEKCASLIWRRASLVQP
uniref:Uncharacterized protein n=1 Tax=Ananas comosus var. bracteatus TaxID=296719 RepID=A0A6V7PHC8_ANACO|nr:unnamed protein product [Ananas comosus var. bracteatus]